MAMFGYILTIRQRKLKHFFNWFIPFPFYVVLFSIISEFDHFHKVGPLNECAKINSKNLNMNMCFKFYITQFEGAM